MKFRQRGKWQRGRDHCRYRYTCGVIARTLKWLQTICCTRALYVLCRIMDIPCADLNLDYKCLYHAFVCKCILLPPADFFDMTSNQCLVLILPNSWDFIFCEFQLRHIHFMIKGEKYALEQENNYENISKYSAQISDCIFTDSSLVANNCRNICLGN